MEPQPAREITKLFVELREGNREAQSRLAELVYGELHRMAQRYMRYERPDHTLQPTILVHETYLELVGSADCSWQNRAHFYAAAALSMRRILIDYARARNAEKRGGRRAQIELDEAISFTDHKCEELLALDEALDRLAALDARQSQVVELRFFGGLTEEEIAKVLNVSVRTVKREWTTARGWLHAELAG
jgi:RNA polymerase sigma factor (TIGR02999 family)